jgi:purine-cytosine permease-like protein
MTDKDPNSQPPEQHVVPHGERRGVTTMALLWVTMVTGFPSVLIGFQWHADGMTLSQAFVGVCISSLILLVYSIPACYLGAMTGKTYTMLSRSAFGVRGSWLVSFNIIVSATAWYALTAIFLAQGLASLYELPLSLPWLAAVLAVLMAFNNFFGFSGVANFARYAAGPVLIVWVLYCFGSAATTIPTAVWTATPSMSTWNALTAVSSFVIGYSVWGNEADYWRFSKAKAVPVIAPLVGAIIIGAVLFPITGWMVAELTHTKDPAQATAVMNSFAFGKARALAAVVLVMTYVAVNDSLLFATVNALENILKLSRRVRVVSLAVTGALLAAWLSHYARSFDVIAAVTGIVLPAATTITMVEWFVPHHENEYHGVHWSAVVSLVVGSAVGIFTSDVLPGFDSIFVPTLNAWLTSLAIYLALRRFSR